MPKQVHTSPCDSVWDFHSVYNSYDKCQGVVLLSSGSHEVKSYKMQKIYFSVPSLPRKRNLRLRMAVTKLGSLLLVFLLTISQHARLSFSSALESVENPVDALTYSDTLTYRRRMQFTTTLSGPPTDQPSMPPTPLGSTIPRDNTLPYIYVDFGHHISWDSANTFCQEQLGTSLASVWRNQTSRISEQEQIDLMKNMCNGKGDADLGKSIVSNDHPDCWIGLKYRESTTLFRWENGQNLEPDGSPNGASITYWRPGTETPTAFYFLDGQVTVCAVSMYIPSVLSMYIPSVFSNPFLLNSELTEHRELLCMSMSSI